MKLTDTVRKGKMEKIDMDSIMKQYGIKSWRRPFGTDPRIEELKGRVKSVPVAKYGNPATVDAEGDNVNFEQ